MKELKNTLKYRLIKKYPGSPSLGTILRKNKSGYSWDNSGPYYAPIITRKSIVENNPEFWEEVVEYPIGTKVYNQQTGVTYTKNEDGWYIPMKKTVLTDENITNKKHLVLLNIDEGAGPNPLNLEIGKEYILKYIHCKSNPKKVLITHFTKNGHPWGKELNGIVSPGCYKITEKVVEKNYEILSYQSKDKIIAPATNFAIEISKPGYWNIHSVKRLSDGEIFTVGDKIITSVSDSYCSIYGLRLSNAGKLVTECTHSYLARERSIDLLEDMQHIKKPLFTTEDGVDLFEGDEFYYITKDFKIDSEVTPIKKECSKYSYNNLLKYCKLLSLKFSTKEAAEEYVLINKPCLSINDFKSFFSGSLSDYNCLRELVKSRL